MTGWAGDPYTAGAYTHVTPGSSNADLDLLGIPSPGGSSSPASTRRVRGSATPTGR